MDLAGLERGLTIASVPTVSTDTGRRYRNRSQPERRAERRARLLAAALDAFAADGYRSTPIERLCAAAGVSTRNFYEEFGGREDLLLTLHDDLNARALTAVIAAIADLDPNDLESRAHAGVSAYFTVMTSDRRWAQIALVESVGVSPEAEAHRRAAIDRFAAVLELEATRLADAGRIPARHAGLTAIALVGAINGLIGSWTADPDWEDHVGQVIDEGARLIVLALRG